jgi:hypothetical protein
VEKNSHSAPRPKGKKKQKGPKTTSNGDASTEASLDNIYSALVVEETTNSEETMSLAAEAQRSGKPAPKTARKKKLRCALEKTEEDGVFALWCLLEQCYELRVEVRELWKEWRSGDLSLAVAGETTDKAFALIRTACDEFAREFSGLSTFVSLIEKLHIAVEAVDGTVKTFSCDDGNFDACKMPASADELLCIPALCNLLTMAKAFLDLRVKGKFATFTALEHVTTGHRLARTLIIHGTELVEIWKQPELFKAFMGMDDFLREFQIFFLTIQLPLHWVIDFQIYMDIYDIIADTGPRPFFVGQDWAKYAEFAYEKTKKETVYARIVDPALGGGPFLPEADWQPLMDQITNTLVNPIRRTQASHIRHEHCRNHEECRKRADEHEHAEAGEEEYLSLLLVYFPVLTGVLLTKLMRKRYLLAMEVCKKNPAVVGTAHLYQACRKSGVLKEKWEDMEFAIGMYGSKQLGLQDIPSPTPVHTAAKHFGIAMGVEVSKYVSAGRRIARHKSYNFARVKVPAERTPAMEKRSATARIAEPYMQLLVSDIATCESVDAVGGMGAPSTFLHRVASSFLSTAASQKVDKGTREQLVKQGQLTPVQLITTLKGALMASEPAMHFNHEHFFGQCVVTLSQLRIDMVPWLEEHNVSLIHESPGLDSPLHSIVDEILWAAAEEELSFMGRRSPYSALECPVRHFEQFNLHVDAGRNCSQNAYARSSGTLMDFLKPGPEDVQDPQRLQERPEYLQNAKTVIQDGKLLLQQPVRDPRHLAWLSKIIVAEGVVKERLGDKSTEDEQMRMMRKVMEELGISNHWKGDD